MKAAGFMIFGRRTVTVHGKLLEEGLARKRKWGEFHFFGFRQRNLGIGLS